MTRVRAPPARQARKATVALALCALRATSLNSAICANHPPTLYVATDTGDRPAKCKTKPGYVPFEGQ